MTAIPSSHPFPAAFRPYLPGAFLRQCPDALDDAMTSSIRRIMTAASAALDDGLCLHPQGLHNTGPEHIDRFSLIDIETEGLLSRLVLCPDRDDHIDGVETGVFGKRPRDDFKRLCECLDRKLDTAPETCGVPVQLERDSISGAPPPATIFLSWTTTLDDHECVMDSTFEFLDYVFRPAPDDQGDRLGIFAFRDKDHLRTGKFLLLHKAGSSRDRPV